MNKSLMNEQGKIRLLIEHLESFKHLGEYFSMEPKECEHLFFKKIPLFSEQLDQELDEETARKLFNVLSKKIFIAHVREKRDGWKWQIEIRPLRPEKADQHTTNSKEELNE